MDKESFGRRLAELREAAGLSRSQLAVKTEIPLRTIEAWEQGRREPYVTFIPRLAKVLRVPVEQLFAGPSRRHEPIRGRPPKGRK